MRTPMNVGDQLLDEARLPGSRSGRALAFSGLIALLAGCGDSADAPEQGLRTEIDTVAGVLHVRSSGPAPAWTAEPALRLGSGDGGPEELGRVRAVIADEQGDIYVADNLAHEVRVFSADGRHLRTIGRQGAGPGEFGDLYGLAWLGGNLAAMDPGNARISILSPDGEWVDGIRHFPITGPATRIRLHPLGDEGFYAPVLDAARRSLPFVRFTTAGPADTIAPPQPPEDAREHGVLCHRADGGITGIAIPEAPAIVYAFPAPGGAVAVAWTEGYRIAVLGPGGDTLRVVTRERPPLPYPDSTWAEAVRPFEELHESFPGSRCEPSEPHRPEHRAALRHIVFDDAGRMWVEAASENGFVWEVFDADGRLLGAAPAPARATGVPPYVRDGRLYVVETDEMDVPHVVVYRVGP